MLVVLSTMEGALVFVTLMTCLAVAVGLLYSVASFSLNDSALASYGILANLAVSVLGFFFTYYSIPPLYDNFIAAGLFGIDLNKDTTKRNKDGSLYRDPKTNRIEGIKVPEAMGLMGSTAYLVCMFLFIPVVSLFRLDGNVQSGTSTQEWFLGEFLAATLSVCCMVRTQGQSRFTQNNSSGFRDFILICVHCHLIGVSGFRGQRAGVEMAR